MSKTMQHEGHRSTFHRHDGSVGEINYKEFSHTISIPSADMPGLGVEQLAGKLNEIGEQMQKSMTHRFTEVMDEASKQAGTGVDFGNRPLDAEGVLQSLEKITMDFGIDGKKQPDLVLIMHPNLQAQAEKIEQDPEFIRKRSELIERKREEYYDRESRRKLVD